jgi:NTE family protein
MNKNVSLVLSGGGARGIAHIGVIEELEKQGFFIKSISGTSMGALVGGVYAIGKMKEFKDWILKLDKMEVFKLVDFTFSSQGLVKGDKVLKRMKEFIPDCNIEELNIHFTATATDIIKKKEVVFKDGSIYEAIRASIAIPTVFTPVKKEKSILVDGGVVNNVPINNVIRVNDDILVVVNVNADIPVYIVPSAVSGKDKEQSAYLKKIKEFKNYLNKTVLKDKNEKLGYFSILDKTLGLMMMQVAQMTLEKYHPEILIEVSRNSCGTFDFYKAEELLEIGRHSAIESLKEYYSKFV